MLSCLFASRANLRLLSLCRRTIDHSQESPQLEPQSCAATGVEKLPISSAKNAAIKVTFFITLSPVFVLKIVFTWTLHKRLPSKTSHQSSDADSKHDCGNLNQEGVVDA